VGAPLPEPASFTSSGTTRLKTKLEGKGKKRLRKEEEDTERGAREEDDGEDSRTGVIRKKVKFDPFATPGKKKKVKAVTEPTNGMHLVDEQANGHVSSNDATRGSGSGMLSDKQLSSAPTTPQDKKKKKRRRNALNDVEKASAGGACPSSLSEHTINLLCGRR
jgi:hypothetical protein